MRIAIVHDALCVRGGAERVALWIEKAFPGAPIYTSVYLPEQTFSEYKALDVRPLPSSRFIRTERQFKLLYPFWLAGLQRIDFSDFDVVLCSSTYLAKFVRVRAPARHIAYLYAPFRLLWNPAAYGAGILPPRGPFELLVRLIFPLLRKWDHVRTSQILKIATTCRHMAQEILDRYDRRASVVYPPVVMPIPHSIRAPEDYFLCVGRLVSHKRVDLAVGACNRLGRKLIVVGEGPERQRLESLAGPTIQFVGAVDDRSLDKLYAGARGLLFPSYEDYGLVPLEAQAHGVPVLAFGRGGALETVKEGTSGAFFLAQDVDSITNSIQNFERQEYDPDSIRAWVRRFEPQTFLRGIKRLVAQMGA